MKIIILDSFFRSGSSYLFRVVSTIIKSISTDSICLYEPFHKSIAQYALEGRSGAKWDHPSFWNDYKHISPITLEELNHVNPYCHSSSFQIASLIQSIASKTEICFLQTNRLALHLRLLKTLLGSFGFDVTIIGSQRSCSKVIASIVTQHYPSNSLTLDLKTREKRRRIISLSRKSLYPKSMYESREFLTSLLGPSTRHSSISSLAEKALSLPFASDKSSSIALTLSHYIIYNLYLANSSTDYSITFDSLENSEYYKGLIVNLFGEQAYSLVKKNPELAFKQSRINALNDFQQYLNSMSAVLCNDVTPSLRVEIGNLVSSQSV